MILSILFIFLFQGVVTTETLEEGSGEAAEIGTTLDIHYIGKLESGKEFDNSYKRGSTIKVTIGKSSVIQGWHIGLQGIKKGEKRRLTIPSKFAYGPRDHGAIPANSTLIFDVEIVHLTPPDKGWKINESQKPTKRDQVTFYDIKIGTGSPADTNSVVFYQYDLYDKRGLKIYSSKKTKKTESIKLGEKQYMIQGLENGLYGIKIGGKRKLICLGPNGDENDLFIFDLEVITIK